MAGNARFMASPWSPPAYMKTNNNMLRGGKLLPEYNDAWALYYTKFIKAYAQQGIPTWAISVQNEPMATQTWESCIYTAEEEAAFLKNHLGPTMHKEGHKDVKIVVWDHNRDLIYQRALSYFRDQDVSKYIWGIGFHWYEDWSGGVPMYDNLRRVHESWPDKNILFTEGSIEKFTHNRITDWYLGEDYATSMINDFNNGMGGFIDWNIFLDETGGPNHVGNFCFAPVHADTRTDEVIYTSAYYYIGHFSKYIQPGARRMAVTPSRSQLLSTGFINPDGTRVLVVMNPSEKEADYFVWMNGRAAKTKAPARSISTVLF